MVTRLRPQTTGNKVVKAARKNVVRAVSGTLGLSGEHTSKVDTAWLRMDTPSNLMVIAGVWVLQPGVYYADVCERMENHLLQYGRFRQYVVEDAVGVTWVEDPHFNI